MGIASKNGPETYHHNFDPPQRGWLPHFNNQTSCSGSRAQGHQNSLIPSQANREATFPSTDHGQRSLNIDVLMGTKHYHPYGHAHNIAGENKKLRAI